MAKLTIGIPTYNRADMLAVALDSVLSQSFADFEVLVLDNASEEGTEAVGQRYAAMDARVRYVRNQRNLGMTRNWMRIVDLSRTDYIKFLMDDDVLLPGCLEAFHQAALEHSDVDLFACHDIQYQVQVPRQEVPVLHTYAPQRVVPGKVMLNFMNQWGNQIGCPTNFMFRKEALKAVYDIWDTEDRMWAPDLHASALVLSGGNFYCINRALVGVHIHPQQISNRLADSTMFQEDARVLDEIARLAGGTKQHMAFSAMQIARLAITKALVYASGGRFKLAGNVFRIWWGANEKIWALRMMFSYLLARIRRKVEAKLLPLSAAGPKLRFRNASMRRFWLEAGLLD
ncbi:glycosyltransferase family 2 protein [Chloroflexota bacterium]